MTVAWTHRYVAALGAAFFVAASQALAAPPCAAPVKDLIVTARTNGIEITPIAPHKVSAFLARLRKIFPDRAIVADEIIAARKPDAHGTAEPGLVYLMLARDGCVISVALVDRESFEMLNGELGPRKREPRKREPSKPDSGKPKPRDGEISS